MGKVFQAIYCYISTFLSTRLADTDVNFLHLTLKKKKKITYIWTKLIEFCFHSVVGILKFILTLMHCGGKKKITLANLYDMRAN